MEAISTLKPKREKKNEKENVDERKCFKVPN